MSDKDFRRMDPIVPERDDIQPRRPAAKKANVGHSSSADKPVKTSGGNGFWKLISGLTLLLLIGVAVFAWQQSQQLAELSARFDELKGRIESTDESLSQSGAVLSVKINEQGKQLETQWTEIKKLWGVSYDTNRKAISANTSAIESQVASVKALEQSIASLKKDVKSASQAVATVNSNSLAVTAQMEELREKFATLSGSIARVENGIKQQQGDLKKRLVEHDEAIRSMDAYRSQINQQLNQIRSQLGIQ